MNKALLAVALLFGLVSAASAATVFDCSGGFSSSGQCGVGNGQPFKVVGNTTPKLEGGELLLFPTGSNHAVSTLIYQTQVNVQEFSTSFQFVPNGLFFSFIFNNTTNSPGYQGSSFQGGAGCEADFFQGYGMEDPPNHVFALDFDSYDPLNPHETAPWDFVYSSVQIYRANSSAAEYPNPHVQCPCIGGDNICGDNTSPADGHHQITKLSTSPVPLNNPVNAAETTTGDTYSASLAYDGNHLTLSLYDVTKGGSCPGSTCFNHTWNDVNVPASVNGDMAWLGLGASSSGSSKHPLYVKSFTYSTGGASAPTPEPVPSSTATPPPAADNCQFTSPLGTVTWPCSAAD